MKIEINAKQFVTLIKRKINNLDFTPIILFGETCSGKSSVCKMTREIIGNVLYDSYSLYSYDIKLKATKKILMREICDKASQKIIPVFSTINIDVANYFAEMLGLNFYNLDKNTAQEIRLGEFKKLDLKRRINLNRGDKILDLQMSKIKKREVYAEVIKVDSSRITCIGVNNEDAIHYPHNFYGYQENTTWKRT